MYKHTIILVSGERYECKTEKICPPLVSDGFPSYGSAFFCYRFKENGGIIRTIPVCNVLSVETVEELS